MKFVVVFVCLFAFIGLCKADEGDEEDGSGGYCGTRNSFLGECAERNSHYCLNGGTCCTIPRLGVEHTCFCPSTFTGIRCEELNLFRHPSKNKSKD